MIRSTCSIHVWRPPGICDAIVTIESVYAEQGLIPLARVAPRLSTNGYWFYIGESGETNKDSYPLSTLCGGVIKAQEAF